MTKVLRDIRVVEHGTFITGPLAGMVLADLGAEVIKIELPGTGDPFRAFDNGLYSPHFQAYNRNKKSLALDTRQTEGRRVFDELIRSADVYIQNFRPNVAEKLGCGAERLMAINPRLVYGSISGFGPDGPEVDRPTYDTVAQAISGYLSMFIAPEDPHVVGPAVADSITGITAACGILAALHERNSTGKGRMVETSMLESMVYFSTEHFSRYFVTGQVTGPFDRSKLAQSYAMMCADGKMVAFHLSSPEKFWDGLLRAVGRPDMATDPRFAGRMDRVANQPELRRELQGEFLKRPLSEWLVLLRSNDVPHAPIRAVDEVLEEPQVKHLGLERHMVHPTEGALRAIRRPIVYDGDRDGIEVLPAPVLDQDGPALRSFTGIGGDRPARSERTQRD